MKRITTEILVEIEETLIMRQTKQTTGGKNVEPPKEILICRNCGQAVDEPENFKTDELNRKAQQF